MKQSRIGSSSWPRGNSSLSARNLFDAAPSHKVPLVTLAGHESKVLAVVWPLADVVLTGGADGEIRTHRFAQFA